MYDDLEEFEKEKISIITIIANECRDKIENSEEDEKIKEKRMDKLREKVKSLICNIIFK